VHEVVARALRDLGVGGANPFLDLLLDLVRVSVRVRVRVRVRLTVSVRVPPLDLVRLREFCV